VTDRRTLNIPLNYPTSLIYVDESGTATQGRVFVVGALKVRRHGELSRATKDVRDRCEYSEEFRFNKIRRSTAHVYCELLETLREADVVFHASIVDRDVYDPTQGAKSSWEAHIAVTAPLLRASINRRELVSVSMDEFSTPPGVALEDELASRVNNHLGTKAIVTAAMLDSKCCDGLQLADLLTSAVALDYRARTRHGQAPSVYKRKVADHAKLVLGAADFVGRTNRSNVVLLQAPKKTRRRSEERTVKSERVVPMKSRRAG